MSLPQSWELGTISNVISIIDITVESGELCGLESVRIYLERVLQANLFRSFLLKLLI